MRPSERPSFRRGLRANLRALVSPSGLVLAMLAWIFIERQQIRTVPLWCDLLIVLVALLNGYCIGYLAAGHIAADAVRQVTHEAREEVPPG